MSDTYTAKQYGYEQPILSVVVPLTVLSMIAVFIVAGDSDTALWVSILGVILIAAPLAMPLSIEVTGEQIRVRFAWLVKRDIALEDVVSVEAREYRALREFGGWGLRYGRHGERAYTVKGNDATVVSLRDGGAVFLGARDTEALAEAIRPRLHG